MKLFNKAVYNVLCLARNKKTLKIFNKIGNIDDYNLIIPNLYLGNINSASDIIFLQQKKIGAIINCTENEPYHEYFDDKPKFRLSINDSKDPENINKFKHEILNSIDFIDECIKNNLPIYVHCYWGLMRSATVIASYLIKEYKISSEDAILLVQERRPYALMDLYNFNEILKFIENFYKIKSNNR